MNNNTPDLEQYLTQSGYTKVNLNKIATGHFELKISINGIAGSFILDTGASGTVVDESRKEKFYINGGTLKDNGAGLGTSTMSVEVSGCNDVMIGTLNIKNMKLCLLNLEHVNNALKAKGSHEVDGVLGADILSSKHGIIDYSSSSLYLKSI